MALEQCLTTLVGQFIDEWGGQNLDSLSGGDSSECGRGGAGLDGAKAKRRF